LWGYNPILLNRIKINSKKSSLLEVSEPWQQRKRREGREGREGRERERDRQRQRQRNRETKDIKPTLDILVALLKTRKQF
jgi:hypothetical protein